MKDEFGRDLSRWSSTAKRSRRRRRSTRSIRRTAQVVGNVCQGDARARRAGDRGREGRVSRRGATPTGRAGRVLCARSPAAIRERRFELAAWIVYESGKPWREADADVAEAIDFCEYYAAEMLRLADPAAPRRARRGERLLLRAARRRRRHRPVELPARDPDRHGRRPRSSPATRSS